MKKLNKIMSILLTAAIATSMLVTSAIPVGAANNAWDEFKVPSATDLVMPNNITASGLLTTAIDGTLYAYIQTPNTATVPVSTSYLAKSVDGGRKWTKVATPSSATLTVTAIATSPNEANVVYVALSDESVWKSTDSGATFAAQSLGTVAGVGVTMVTSLAVSLQGGSYKVFAGTDAGVYFFDEGVALNNQFNLFGGLTAVVLDVKLSPTFSTAAGIFALTTGGSGARVFFSTGGAFNPTFADIGSIDSTAGEIGFSADYNATNNPVFFVGVNGTNGGIFRVTTGAAVGLNIKLTTAPAVINVVTLDVNGSGVFGGAVNIIAGTAQGVAYLTMDAGQTFKSVTNQNLTGTGAAFVALKSDFTTSGVSYVLKAATAGVTLSSDESGFSMSANQGVNYAQIGLLNSTITTIDNTVFAANGDVFLVTADPSGASLWRNMGGNWERIGGDKTAGTFAMLAVSPNYATDKGVFYVAANVFQRSGNNGVTFTSQSLTPGTVNAFQVIDFSTIVVANPAGIVRTSNNGFSWPSVSSVTGITRLVRSSDGTAMAAVTGTGGVISSADAGSTWTTTTVGTLTGISAVTFENGSNTKLWASVSGAVTPGAGDAFTLTATAYGPGDTFIITAAAAGDAVTITGAVTVVVTNDADADTTVVGIGTQTVTFGDATDAVTATATAPTSATVTVTAGAPLGADGVDTNGSLTGGFGAAFLMDMNIIATVTGAATASSATPFVDAALGTVVTYTATAAGNVTWTATSGGFTAAETVDTNSSMTVGASGVAFAMDMNPTSSGGGLRAITLTATTPAWSTSNQAGAAGVIDSPATSTLTNGVGVASGVASTGFVVYALNSDGNVTRKLSTTGNNAGNIAPITGMSTATALFIQSAAGANKLWVVSGGKIFTLTDQMAVGVAGVAIGSFTTTSAVVNWTALAAADRYQVAFTTGSTALTNPYTAATDGTVVSASVSGTTATISAGLAANTTYTVSVWAVRADEGDVARISFAGSATFSTQPSTPPGPVDLAPTVGATGIALTPGFGWGAVPGATSYELQLSTSDTFATLVGTTVTTTNTTYAWTTPALTPSTTYYWRVRAVTATGTSNYVNGIFTTVPATPTATTAPPPVTVTNTTVTLPTPATPAYIWVIIGIGAILVILIIVLIVRTRRTV